MRCSCKSGLPVKFRSCHHLQTLLQHAPAKGAICITRTLELSCGLHRKGRTFLIPEKANFLLMAGVRGPAGISTRNCWDGLLNQPAGIKHTPALDSFP